MNSRGAGPIALLARGGEPASTVIFGRFVSTVGYYLVIPFLAFHLVQTGMSGFQAGMLFAILNFSRRGLGIPAGWASDHFGAVRVLALGLFIETVSYLGFALAASFWQWAVAVALLGTGGSLNSNGSRTLLAKSGGGSSAAVGLSRYYVMINAAALIGPLAGALLLDRGAIKIAFLAAALLHLLFAMVTVLLFRQSAAQPAPQRRAPMVGVLRDSDLLKYCASTIGGWFLLTQLYVALPLTIDHQKISSSVLGPLNALNALIVMVAVWLIGKPIGARTARQRIDILGVSGAMLAVGWLACVVDGIPALVVAVVVVSLGESLFCAVVDTTAAALAPPGRSGIYLGVATMAWAIGGTVGSLTAGCFQLAADAGVLWLYWLLLSMAGLVTTASARMIRQRLEASIVQRQQDLPSMTAPA